MATPPPYFARVIPEVDFPLLQAKRVVIVGIGQVGSKIAAELAHASIGFLRFVDHDALEESNLYRHVLPSEYVGRNKADALAVYLAGQVTNLRTEAVPCAVDNSVPDALLDSWLSGTDLIIATTDNPEAQLRIGARALALEIPAVFPALYPRNNGGEIILQFDRTLPCFGCFAGFRARVPQLEGVTGLGFFGMSVIETALQLALALLEPDSDYLPMISPRRNEAPHQIFMLDRARGLSSRPLDWFAGCTSCGGGPTALRRGGMNTRNIAEGPTTIGSSPGPTFQPETVRDNLRPVWIVAAAVIVLIGIIAIPNTGGGTGAVSSSRVAQVPSKTPAEMAAETASKERAAAEERVAQLSFACIERYVCRIDPLGRPLPLFIDGMDEKLQEYLESHGYTDSWTDSTGRIHGQTIGPHRNVADGQTTLDSYVSSYEKKESGELPIGTGLIYEPQEAVGGEPGPRIEDLPSDGQWTITWILSDSAGHIVRRLDFRVEVAECSESEGEQGYCNKVKNYENSESNNGETNGAYSTTFYHRPPLFPY